MLCVACSATSPRRVPLVVTGLVATVRRFFVERLMQWRARRLGRGGFASVRVDPDTDDDVEQGPVDGSADVDGPPPSSSSSSSSSGRVGDSGSGGSGGGVSGAAAGTAGATESNALGAIDCVICMTEVVVAERDYMVTPCSHLFHEACLRQWMDVKMECPTCRALLPSP